MILVLLVRKEFIILTTVLSGGAEDSCVYCLNCCSVWDCSGCHSGLWAAQLCCCSPSSREPAVLGTQWLCEQQGCAQPLLLCSHSSQQQPLGFTGLAVVTLWLQGEFILQPCCLCVSPVLCYLASSRLAGALECSFRDAFCVSSSVCCRCKFLAFL